MENDRWARRQRPGPPMANGGRRLDAGCGSLIGFPSPPSMAFGSARPRPASRRRPTQRGKQGETPPSSLTTNSAGRLQSFKQPYNEAWLTCCLLYLGHVTSLYPSSPG